MVRHTPAAGDSVHPRASGEHGQVAGRHHAGDGSSPRERGTPFRAAGDVRPGLVHPRASGEHVTRPSGPGAVHGSSPRERGTQSGIRSGGRFERFIPARAGNTVARPMRARGWPVHPRASGEHPLVDDAARAQRGSSPRERGTQKGLTAEGCSGRFIPARAGNTGVA